MHQFACVKIEIETKYVKFIVVECSVCSCVLIVYILVGSKCPIHSTNKLQCYDRS